MAKVAAEKKYVSFVKGLITEANALTFPENASLDEDNFDLNIDGSRFRRLGVDYEDGYTLTATGIAPGILSTTRKSFHRWDFPNGATDVAIGIIRVDTQLWFINLLGTIPSSSLLNGGIPITIPVSSSTDIDVAVINNYAIIVSESLNYPILLKYNPTTHLVTQENIPIQVRDIWGIEDGLELDTRPSPLSNTHEYNLRNQGWSSKIETTSDVLGVPSWITGHSYVVGDLATYTFSYPSSPTYLIVCLVSHTSGAIDADYAVGKWALYTSATSFVSPTRAYTLLNSIWNFITPQTYHSIASLLITKANLSVYPSNTDIWTLGKVGSSLSANFEKYDPATMKRNSIDNTEAPKGSYVLDLYKRGYSRQLLTGLSTLPIDEELGRVSTVASFAGRVWYSGITSSVTNPDSKSPNLAGSVFYSQVIENRHSVGKCFQEADPTSPTISDIVATDGGVINFPEINKVVKLVGVKDSLIVFAENGVWEIYGDMGAGFKATGFQVSKISTMGISNPRGVVIAGNSVVYWTKAGIYVATPNPQTGRYETQNISLATIQTYYNSIPDLAKKHARGFYDERENHIRWLYNDTVVYAENLDVNHYNRVLNFDLTLNAFYKYSIAPLAANSPMISDWIEIPSFAVASTAVDIYVGNDPVIIPVDNPVQITATESVARESKHSFLTFTGGSFTLSKFKDTSFMDWKTSNGVGSNYSSYLITGYEVFGDVMRNKQIPYIWFYLKRTEDGFLLDGLGNLVAKNQSSCLVQAQWNWSNSDAQGKWGTQFQAYRYLRPYTPTGIADTYDTGDSLIVTKNKFRGSGKAISLKLQSEQGKDMKLMGWAILISGDGTP